MPRLIHRLAFISLVPLLLAACGTGSADRFPTPAPNLSGATIPTTTPGPVPGTVIRFPADEAPHPAITEWWYYTGHVITADGQRYGVEYVIFQGSRADFPLGYAAHFAIINAQTRAFAFDEQTAIARTAAFGGDSGFQFAGQ